MEADIIVCYNCSQLKKATRSEPLIVGAEDTDVSLWNRACTRNSTDERSFDVNIQRIDILKLHAKLYSSMQPGLKCDIHLINSNI